MYKDPQAYRTSFGSIQERRLHGRRMEVPVGQVLGSVMGSVPHILPNLALEKHGPTPGMPRSSLIDLLLIGKVVCEEPNSRMHYFMGHLELEGKKFSLDSGNILLRGCKIRNTDTCYGMVIYAGMTTLGPLQHELPWWWWGGETSELVGKKSQGQGLPAECLLSQDVGLLAQLLWSLGF